MARVHVLASCAVMLGRLCGFSATFDDMADLFLPFAGDKARTDAWAGYVNACELGRPVEVRDELWLIAHMNDMAEVRSSGLYDRFTKEAAQHSRDTLWRLVKRHMDVTLGARMLDEVAISGVIAAETAIAHSFSLGLGRLFHDGWDLIHHFAWETAKGLFTRSKSRSGIASYREASLQMLRCLTNVWSASAVYRRGMRARDRGSEVPNSRWNLLPLLLGDEVARVHPLIVEFYDNPSRFQARGRVELPTLPGRIWSRAATRLLGQGAFEQSAGDIDVRFRAFRRVDGSMHFVRELFVGDTMRVFDSDFVIRDSAQGKVLAEVFSDLKVEALMTVSAEADGSISIRGKEFRFRGGLLPTMPWQVQFKSRVVDGQIEIRGDLLLEPQSALGRAFFFGLLRRPKLLGSIHYTAWPAVPRTFS